MGLLTAEVDVENFVLVTHAVPADRVRPQVPARYDLQTFVSEEGREMALISASCFCNRQFHWTPARRPAHDFNQNTFRTYVTHKGKVGSYFFATYVDTAPSYLAQSMLARDIHRATFEVDTSAGEAGYPNYSLEARASTNEVLAFELEALERPQAIPPFSSAREMIDFITYRLHGFSSSPFGEVWGPIEHRHMEPWAGNLLSGRFDLWARRGLLQEDEWNDALHSVLVDPGVHFTLHPPRPAR